ncbi:GNAT family N-acetyltransferase [Corynebacterium sp. H128]|uniref:GNAT family N-acetyltransferase n=1 Tax=unclassified Corynebacterium TaxID=2624378 RepID=UPI00309D0F4E
MADVRHNDIKSRYEILVDGEVAGFAEYQNSGTTRDFHHTVVDAAYQGQGLSKQLIQEALNDTRHGGFLVVPSCSAVSGFIAKNPDYEDLLA